MKLKLTTVQQIYQATQRNQEGTWCEILHIQVHNPIEYRFEARKADDKIWNKTN